MALCSGSVYEGERVEVWCGEGYLAGRGGAARRGAAGVSQPVQVRHDDHGRLPQVDSQVIVLRKGQVAQEALIRAQGSGEDLRGGQRRSKRGRSAIVHSCQLT